MRSVLCEHLCMNKKGVYGCPKGGRGCKTKSVGFFFFTWVNNNSELGIGRKVLGFSFSRFVETKAKCLRIKIMNDGQ